MNKNAAQLFPCSSRDGEKFKMCSSVKFIAAFDLRQCNKYICADVETMRPGFYSVAEGVNGCLAINHL